MNKVGLVTLYRNNFGSILQCYATKKYLENKGYTCDILSYKESKVNQKVKNIFYNLYRSVRFKGYFNFKYKMKESFKVDLSILHNETIYKMNKFVDEVLKPCDYTWNELKKIGNDSEYKAFIVGSDQVWNISSGMTKGYYLEFCPKHKRVSLAPSFGISTIPSFYEAKVKKGLKGFNVLSVREETGCEIIKKIDGREAIRLPDPTILLTKNDWKFFSLNSSIKIKDKYILLHFLNKPNETALKIINEISEKNNLKVIILSYYYANFERLKNIELYEADPYDYVKLIDEAEYVFTDSFHTTLFSINLEKLFYTFHRQYSHNCVQSSRIVDLLQRYSLSNRLIESYDQFIAVNKLEMIIQSQKLIYERNKIENYLSKCFEVINNG